MFNEVFLAQNRQILNMPMEIVNMLHESEITYDEAETILDVVCGMIKSKREQCEGDVVSRTEKIDWDNV